VFRFVFCKPKTRLNLFKSEVYEPDSKPRVFGFKAKVFGLKPKVLGFEQKVLGLKQKVLGFKGYKVSLQA
jgi:hypothetical protein